MGLKETVAKNIRMYRLKKGLTQEALAKATGWEATYINRVERNPQNLGLETLERIAKPLGVSPAQLLARGNKELDSDIISEQFLKAFEILDSIRPVIVSRK